MQTKQTGDFRTQQKTPRGRVSLFNLTTEPVNWLLLPLWQFMCSVKAVPWCESHGRAEHCRATSITQANAMIRGLGPLWSDMPVKETLSQGAYSQSWSSRPGFWGASWPNWRVRRLRMRGHKIVFPQSLRWVSCNSSSSSVFFKPKSKMNSCFTYEFPKQTM